MLLAHYHQRRIRLQPDLSRVCLYVVACCSAGSSASKPPVPLQLAVSHQQADLTRSLWTFEPRGAAPSGSVGGYHPQTDPAALDDREVAITCENRHLVGEGIRGDQ